MDLKCRLGHLFGQSVLVNGTTYAISAEGLARDVKAEDAKKLLADRSGWAEVTIRTPPRAEPATETSRAVFVPDPLSDPPITIADGPTDNDPATKRRAALRPPLGKV